MKLYTTIIIILISLLIFNTELKAQKIQYQSSGTTENLTSVHFVDNMTGYIVGWNGTILKTMNSGDKWEKLENLNDEYTFRSVYFFDKNIGWIVGYKYEEKTYFEIIIKTIDGGNNWEILRSTNNNREYILDNDHEIFFINDKVGWFATTSTISNSHVFKTNDGGYTWNEQLSINFKFHHFTSICFINQDYGWINGGWHTYKTIDGGINWVIQSNFWDTFPCETKYSSAELRDIFFLNENDGWVLDRCAGPLKTTDGGIEWHCPPDNIAQKEECYQFYSFGFPDSSYGICTGSRTIVTNNGGITWEFIKELDNFRFRRCFVLDKQNVWLVGDQGKIVKLSLTDLTGIQQEKIIDNALKNYELSQNYPNPFNPSTTIEFTLPKSEFVELKVYNILGKEVYTLVSNKLNQGNYTYQFDGTNLASGVYYYQLVAGNFREVKKMILLR